MQANHGRVWFRGRKVNSDMARKRAFILAALGAPFALLAVPGVAQASLDMLDTLDRGEWELRFRDGDNVRKGLNSNLSFSPEDRSENIRRIAEVANLMLDAGLVVLASFVSPYREDRENVKRIVGYENFVEVFVNTPIEECERRDVKGLYAKARAGEIENFTGVNAPYEPPMAPDVEIDTMKVSVGDGVALIVEFIAKKM